MRNFNYVVPGKWILSGEHTVLRGGEALVFPLPSQNLSLKYIETDSDLEISARGENSTEIEFIIWSVIERALKKLNLKRRDLKGEIHFESNIRFGAGVGASATLCSSLALFFVEKNKLKPEQAFEFARDLENIFHGESSGVDVAVALQKKPLLFSRLNGFSDLKVASYPRLYLSFTGARGVTKDCVDQVKKLIELEPEKSLKIDQNMIKATDLFKKLLSDPSRVNLDPWVEALQLAQGCFDQWGLSTEATEKHRSELISAGALAVKLTGSGRGGYMLSLWDHVPESVAIKLIPCFT